jgi:hypothetical protein
MALTKYTYEKTVASDRLTVEIQDSSITIALDHIDTYFDGEGDACVDIYFKDALSASEQTTLDTIVADHVPTPLPTEPETVIIQEENYLNQTGGHFRCVGVEFTATNNASTTYDFSFPYPIALLACTFPTVGKNSGDKVELNIAPDTIIGAITANVSAEATSINVQSSVISNISVGQHITLADGSNTDECLVTAINTSSNILSVEIGPDDSYLASTPTYVKKTVKMAQDLYIEKDSRYELGVSKIGGSYIPANITLRVIYTNSSGSDIKVRPIFEFLY